MGRIIKIQTLVKSRKENMKEREDQILKNWSAELIKMKKWCLNNQKHPKSKIYIKKLGVQEDTEVRDRIIQMYLQACHLYHIQLYFKWRVVHYEECVKKEKLIPDLIKMKLKLSNFLFRQLSKGAEKFIMDQKFDSKTEEPTPQPQSSPQKPKPGQKAPEPPV